MSLVTVFNTDYSESHKKPLNSLKFWKKFHEIRVNGYTKFISFMEPHLSSLSNELKEFNDPAESEWVESINYQIQRERAHLTMLKENRKAYGDMVIQLRELENNMKEKSTELESIESAYEKLKEECHKIQETITKDSEKFDKKIIKFEDMLFSTPNKEVELKERGEKLRALERKYEKHRTQYEDKTTDLVEKSDEIFTKFEEKEREKTTTLVQTWHSTRDYLSRNFEAYVETMATTRNQGMLDDINVEGLVQREKTNREQKTRILKFRKSSQILEGNSTVKQYLEALANETTENQESSVENAANYNEDKQPEAEQTQQHQQQDQPPPPLPPPPAVAASVSSGTSKGKGKLKKGKQKPKTNEEEVTYVTHLNLEDLSSDEESAKPIDEYSRNNKKLTMKRPFEDEMPSTSGYKRPVSTGAVVEKESSSNADKLSKVTKTQATRRPLPMPPTVVPPTRCWDEEAPSTSGHRPVFAETVKEQRVQNGRIPTVLSGEVTNDDDEFESYKTKVKRAHKKERECEMSVKKGDKITVIARPENGYVMARKKSLMRNQKEGLIPVWTI